MHPEIDRFAHLRSPIHAWDPRWKLASLFAFIILAAWESPRPRAGQGLAAAELASQLGSQLALAGVALSLLAASRIPPGFIWRRLRGVAWFLGALLVVLSWRWVPGEGLSWAADGIYLGATIGLRAVAIVTAAIVAFATARFDVTLKACGALRVPAPLIQVVLFSYRYLFVYLDQLRRIGIAQRARGFRPRTDAHTLRTWGSSVGVLLIGSVERTERIQGAMRCRGFSGNFRVAAQFRTRPRDVILSAVVVGTAAALLAWRVS